MPLLRLSARHLEGESGPQRTTAVDRAHRFAVVCNRALRGINLVTLSQSATLRQALLVAGNGAFIAYEFGVVQRELTI